MLLLNYQLFFEMLVNATNAGYFYVTELSKHNVNSLFLLEATIAKATLSGSPSSIYNGFQF